MPAAIQDAMAPGLVDAFLQDLAVAILLVEHQLIGILGLIELADLAEDAELAEHAFHAEGAAFVGNDRHDALADVLVAQQRVEDAHEGHGGGDLAILGRLQLALEGAERGNGERLGRFLAALRQVAAERLAAGAQVAHLLAAFGEGDERQLFELVVCQRHLEAVAELLQRLQRHLLGLMADHLAFAGRAHAVALDGLGEDEARLAFVLAGGLIGGVDLLRIMAAARQLPDLLVRPVGDEGRRFGIAAEEVLADVGAVLRLEVLVFAVDALLHQLAQFAGRVARQQFVPLRAPHDLDHVPAGTAEVALQLLDDLAVAAHGAVEPLQVAVDDEDQVVELLASGQRNGAEAFRLVHLAVAAEDPDLALFGVGQAAGVEILQEAGLIDRHQGPEAHGHRGELPEVRHQPGVRVGRDALAADFLAEIEELFLAQPALKERAGVNAGRGVALHQHQVAAVRLVGRVPEMHEAGIVEGRRRLEARQVAAQFGRVLVGLEYDRHRIPADDGANAVLDRARAGMMRLLVRRDGIDVGGIGGEGHLGPVAAGRIDNLGQNAIGRLGSLKGDDRSNGLIPFSRL